MVLAHLISFIAALSLLLCLAAVAIWVRSFWVSDSLIRKVDGVWDIPISCVDAVVSARGGLVFVEEYMRIDDIAAAYLNMIPVEWKRDHLTPEPAYPSVTLAQISPMDMGEPADSSRFVSLASLSPIAMNSLMCSLFTNAICRSSSQMRSSPG
jgi:hypothetical protein